MLPQEPDEASVSGMALARYAWWRRSSVAARSSSGLWMSAATRSADRDTLNAASSWGTLAGCSDRASFVDSVEVGTKTTGETPRCTSSRL